MAETDSKISPAAKHMHRFNSHVAQDSRVEAVILPAFDGLSLIRLRR